MTTIWKFEFQVATSVAVEMPKGAGILSVASQHGDLDRLAVWAVVNPEAPRVRRKIIVRGTGQPFGDTGPLSFVGTVVVGGGRLVWHVFDAGEEPK